MKCWPDKVPECECATWAWAPEMGPWPEGGHHPTCNAEHEDLRRAAEVVLHDLEKDRDVRSIPLRLSLKLKLLPWQQQIEDLERQKDRGM